MTPERYQRLCALFDQAQQLPPVEREAFIHQASAGDSFLRADLEKMLYHDARARGERLFQGPCPVTGPPFLPTDEPADALVGRRVGPYLIEQRLGSGGMGSVYRALRADAYRQQGALKVVRPGPDNGGAVARFGVEPPAPA